MKKRNNTKVILSLYEKTQINAGPKAKVDIETIVSKNYDFTIDNVNSIDNSLKGKINRFFKCVKINIKNKNTKLVLLQIPYSEKKYYTNMIRNKIIIIHDIEGLRYSNRKRLEKEIEFYKKCYYIISHNKKMTNFLIKNGIEKNKIIDLELFDYLTEEKAVERKIDKNNINIVYSGNLIKAPFLKQLEENKMKFKLNTYGIMDNELKNKNIIYKGKFKPDEIPGKLEGELGLVWDGNLDDKDEKDLLKNYTKYNNPHKLSCYIAAELPVIVWSKAAIADLVDKYNIGYKIDSLYDINDLDFSDYNEKLKNVKELSKKVRDGYFTKRAIKTVLDRLEKDNVL